MPRPALKDLKPYLPGKPIGEVRREFGLPRIDKLASNENPLGVSPRALKAAERAVRACRVYPEGSSPALRQRIAREHKIPAHCVVAANGSDEVIRLVCEAYLDPGDEAVISRHAFIRFRQQSLLMGARVVDVPERGGKHDLQAMAAACGPRTKLLFVASPNNPTGTYNTEPEVRALLEAAPPHVLVVLDEAYHHFARVRHDYPDSIPALTDRHPNLLVLRTFSKAYGLAGLRVGYGVGSGAVIAELNRIRMPFNVSLPAQAAAAAALDDRGFVARTVAHTERAKARLRRGLNALGLDAGDSAANFLFVEVPRDGRVLFEALLRDGVIVRPLGEYGLTRHLRITVGTEAQNRRLLAALKRALKPGGKR